MSAKDNPVVVNEPPDDDVKIGESPDGDRLGGDQARWLLTNRRKVLVGLGTLGSIAALAEADLGGSGGANLYGGTMALDKAYKIGPRTYMGPDSAKSNALSSIDDSEGWRYEAVDTQVQYYLDDGAWQLEGIGSSQQQVPEAHIGSGYLDDGTFNNSVTWPDGSTTTESPSGGVADRTITSTSELESLPSDIKTGERVRIEQPDTPYRPASWPSGGKWAQIDVSNIEIICECPFAGDGQPLVKPADGSDIGGLHVGATSAVSDIRLKNWGFHGNQSTMDDTVKRLHAVRLDDATNVALDGGAIEKTHPYQEHNSGGSGVSLSPNSVGCTVRGVWIDDIGDRGIQAAGTGHRIYNNRARNGYDRSVSFDMQYTDGTFYGAKDTYIGFNYCGNNSDGACVAQSEGSPSNVTVVGNVCEGYFSGGVQTEGDADGVVMAYNMMRRTATDNKTEAIMVVQGQTAAIGNTVRDNTSSGTALVQLNSDGVVALNVLISNGSNDGVKVDSSLAGSGQIVHNLVRDIGSGGVAFNVNDSDMLVKGNYARTGSTADAFIKTGSSGSNAKIVGNHWQGASDPTTFYDFNSSPAQIRNNDPPASLDVRNLESIEGNRAYHDGSGSNTVGPAFYDGSSWTSLVDGTTIS